MQSYSIMGLPKNIEPIGFDRSLDYGKNERVDTLRCLCSGTLEGLARLENEENRKRISVPRILGQFSSHII